MTSYWDGDGLWSTQKWSLNSKAPLAGKCGFRHCCIRPCTVWVSHFRDNCAFWHSGVNKQHSLPSFQATPRAGINFYFLLTFGSTESPICGLTRYPNSVDTLLRCSYSHLRLEKKDKSYVCPHIPYFWHLGTSGILFVSYRIYTGVIY